MLQPPIINLEAGTWPTIKKSTNSRGKFSSAGRGKNIIGARRVQPVAEHNAEQPHREERQSRESRVL
jgi:hypothetical protein